MPKIYNTLTKQTDFFRPMRDGKVNMFVCGPTVYDYIHAGNARTFTIFDTVAKYLSWSGYEVNYIQNITDIDDKIIDRAQKEGMAPLELAEKYYKAFLEDVRALKITSPDRYIKATDHISDIIKQVETLIANGYAYTISDGIYFDLSKFPDYGKLSGRTSLSDDDAVSRIDENSEKRNAGDFCLWKRSKPGEPSWPAPWFDGRPGWHIEDTAITESVFGPQYDLHGGGRDLIFPHHEAEITQQESASGLKPFVRYWMHTGFLQAKSVRMGKSLGNFSVLRDLLGEYSAETLRLFFLSAHYRSPLDFSPEALAQAEAGVERISEFMSRLKAAEEHAPASSVCDYRVSAKLHKIYHDIHESMEDDFNTPRAIAAVFDLIRLGNQYLDEGKLDLACAGRMLDLLDFAHSVLGIVPMNPPEIPADIRHISAEREKARDNKDFATSDKLRADLADKGWSVDDTPWGPRIKKTAR